MSFYTFWEAIKKYEEVEAHQGHFGTGGIQKHSMGVIFPLRIQIVGHGPGKIQVMDGATVVIEEPFESMGDDGDFKDAHQRAEAQAMELIRRGDYDLDGE